MKKIIFLLLIAVITASCFKLTGPSPVVAPGQLSWQVLNTTPPQTVVKYFFAHHSTGSAWIQASCGGLGTALNANNYYVTESDYGWEPRPTPTAPAPIGSYTDTIHWPYWFVDDIMQYVYTNTSHYDYTNTFADPGGDIEVVMFKSCYPNSEVGDSIEDEKAIYNGLLNYFSSHTDKLFILAIPPPEIDISSQVLTREISNWLADRRVGWLSGYPHNNVYAFDYYNVLTHTDNHHWVAGNCEMHEVNVANNELYYPSGDSHPTCEGHQKATAEFIPLLNGWYNLWKGN